MSDEIKDKDELLKGGEPHASESAESAESVDEAAGVTPEDEAAEQHSDYKPVNRFDASAVRHLSGMYQNWFLDLRHPGACRAPYRGWTQACAATHSALHEAHG